MDTIKPKRKQVTIKLTLKYQYDVPADWGKKMIEFHLNESSSCADNVLQDIKAHIKKTRHCLCGNAKFRVVRS